MWFRATVTLTIVAIAIMYAIALVRDYYWLRSG